MSSKKTVLKETPNLPVASQQRTKQKSDVLHECINTILRRELLHLNIKKVFEILNYDLKINLKNASLRMKHVLSECLCYYMKMWPGWKQYEVVCTNERSKMEYIEKFKEYLRFKINYILENEKLFDPEDLNKKRPDMVTQEIQTDPICKRNKPEAPYNLVVSGQPNVLNNIVFIEMDNNIIIKQHAEKVWKPLVLAEFLNYSFVYVTIKLPDLEMCRSNLHEFQRYITECGDSASCPDVAFISYIRKVNAKSKSKVYSKDYIHAYCKQFLDTIKKIEGINTVKIGELEEVFRQFILDIEESNVFSCTNSAGQPVNTMATNTSVCFNMGKRTYIRNKKMVVNTDNQKEANAINFCEVLIPRIAYTLLKFDAEEDICSEDTSFKSLNKIQLQADKSSGELFTFIEAVNNSVAYHCLLCPKAYTGDRAYIDILDHYRFLHKGEQAVLCFTCRKQFSVAKLAGNRWSHDCTVTPKADAAAVTKADSSKSSSSKSEAERLPIGISDILESTASTLSFDDLKKKQSVPAGNASNISRGPSISNSVINTLPEVQGSTSSTTTNVLVTLAPGLTVSSNMIPPNTYTILNSTPLTILSNPLSVSSNPVTVVTSNTISGTSTKVINSLNINENTEDIKLEVNSEYEIPNMTAENFETQQDVAYRAMNTAIVNSPAVATQISSAPTEIPPLILADTNTIMPMISGRIPLMALPVFPPSSVSTVTTSAGSTNNVL